jgi:hypothetical protein
MPKPGQEFECRDFLAFIQAHPQVRDRLDLEAHNRLAQVAGS